jgi:site-specific DNA recombinase
MKRIRCAIYTRKSSDEGLEQDFNSLDAQFEACSAYILSQASEGWNAVPTRYDDGGVSGGTLERPALKRLLKDIASGLIDTVVVYKIDRLTRSLLDFAKLVDAFDKADTSFVSITQSFNTTTSMGRLTLNMLLSFAQFEREVTAERIRDKIAASKAKGMWMGGTPPLGYAADGRSLKIIAEHAELIRDIYRRYLKLGSVRLLEDQLDTDGISVPERTAGTGKITGGGKFLRGQLYTILDNPIYKGDIKHGKKTYPGLHQAIIDPDLWEQVQLKRRDNVRGHRSQYLASHQSLLAGKLFDEVGRPLIAVHANKGTKRYRYYVSRHLHHKTSGAPGWRIPAKEVEGLISLKLQEMLQDPIGMLGQMQLAMPAPTCVASLLDHSASVAHQMEGLSSGVIPELVTKAVVSDNSITVQLSVTETARLLKIDLPSAERQHSVHITAKLTRSGVAMKLVQQNGTAPVKGAAVDTLLKTIARGNALWQRLQSENTTVTELAKIEEMSVSYLTRVLRLAFLDPWIVEQIIAGRQPATLDARKLTLSGELPMRWNHQRKFAGFSATR